MARTILLSLPLFLLACRADNTLKTFNAEPVAEITSHEDGTEVLEGYPTSFRGAVSDSDHSADSLTATWYLDGAILCEGAPPDAEGFSTCETIIPADASQVTLEVQDPENAAGSDQVSLVVVPTESPDAEITAPTADGIFYSDQKITFSGIASDGEDAPADLIIVWESDLDGTLDLSVTPDADGEFANAEYLSEGEHFVTLTAIDSSEKSGSDSVILTVGPPNSAPSCGITAPEDGAAGEENETVLFEALVADVDVPADWLSVTWESDKDGVLGESNPDSTGAVAFLTSDLSVDSHVITLSAADEVGATCSDFIIYTIGTPPNLNIESPVSGDVYDEGALITFQATVSDGEDFPTELSLSWTSDLDGEFSTQGSDSTGAIAFNEDGLSVGTHSITVTATDTDGFFASALLTLRINGIPTAPEVALSPDPATTTDDLTVAITADSTDEDGDPIGYTYAWYADGVLSSASTSASLSSADTTRGQTWTVEVTPNDGDTDGPSGSASVEIVNTAPEVSLVTISPNPATVSDSLSCSYTYDDDDGDTDASTIEWDIDGTVVGTGDTLSSGYTGGSVVTCTVTPDDGTDAGTASSDLLIIDNTPPELTDVELGPEPAYEGDTLSCTPGEVVDEDGTTSFTYGYAWTVDGSDPGESTDTLSSDDFDRDQEVICYVTPNDGTDDGDAFSSNILTISNTAPRISSVSITPASPRPTDTLGCSYSGFEDADGDSDASTYAWTLDGVEIGTSSTLSSGYGAGDVLTCTVTPDDGDEEGTALSDSVTVVNTAPEVTDIELSPTTIYTDDVLGATVSSSDDDGDAVSLRYEWYVDGSLVAETSDTLDGTSYFDKDEEVYLVVTPSDAYDDGMAVSSDSIIVSNTAPTAPEVSIETVGGCDSDWSETADGERCMQAFSDTVTWADALSDCEGQGGSLARVEDSTEMTWVADLVSDTTGASEYWIGYNDIDSEGSFVWSDGVSATYTNWRASEPNDSGGEDCTQVEASSLWNDMPCSHTSAYVCQIPMPDAYLQCVIDTESEDADGDAVSYTFAWDADGVAYTDATTTTETGDTVESADSGLGETWTCTVTPDDGDDDGATGEDSLYLGVSARYWRVYMSSDIDGQHSPRTGEVAFYASGTELSVTSSMATSSATCAFGSSCVIADPIPFGYTNNCSDDGWIWTTGSSFEVDFGSDVALDGVSFYHVYGGGSRSAEWLVESSDDGSTWETQATLTYEIDYCGWMDFDW